MYIMEQINNLKSFEKKFGLQIIEELYSLTDEQIRVGNSNTNYEFPSKDFFNLLDYFEYLIQERGENFSFATSIKLLNLERDLSEFNGKLSEMLSLLDNSESFLANTNDIEFLSKAERYIHNQYNSLRTYIQTSNMSRNDPGYEKYKILYSRLHNIFHGNDTRVSDLLKSNGFTLEITPYYGDFERICRNISEALKSIEPKLNEMGFILDEDIQYILTEEIKNKKAQYDAYVDYDQRISEGKVELLKKGMKSFRDQINFTIKVKIRRKGNTIFTEINNTLPAIFDLDEIIHVYLSSKNPSLNDVLMTVKEIFARSFPNSQLYQEVLKIIAEACEELRIFDAEIEESESENKFEKIKHILVNRMSDSREGEYFIKTKLLPKLKSIEKAFASYLGNIIRGKRN